MKTWIIEPHDSFIARDGRPFGLLAGVRATSLPFPSGHARSNCSTFTGVRATSLPFPFPSTTTGGVRTRDGLNTEGVFDTSKIKDVKEIEVRGALLVEIDDKGNITQWFANAPADALLLDATDKDKNKAKVRRLVPDELPNGALTNMPDGLMPLYLKTKDKSKPHGYAPRFWNWNSFKDWLIAPKDFNEDDLYNFGVTSLPQDERSHVAIESATQANEEGKLFFQTRGLEFTRQKHEHKLGTATRLALAIATDATNIADFRCVRLYIHNV
jgi:CRISPR-associated protein Cmr3